MQKKSVFVALGTVLVLIVASLTLVFTIKPKVSADEVVLIPIEYLDIQELNRYIIGEGSQHGVEVRGFTPDGKEYIKGLSKYSVVIPDGVNWINDSAFNGCVGLSAVAIPSGVTKINSFAFNNTGLTEIDIPATVTTLGDRCFANCGKLVSILVDQGNTKYTSQDDNGNEINAIVVKSSKSLIAGCKNSQIPMGIKNVGSGAFSGCIGLTNIEIPASVTSIGSSAFQESGLLNLDIPSTVTSIGSYAFCRCSSLTSITIPEGIQTLGMRLFDGCTSLTNVTLPTTVTSIENNVFDGCSSLTNIEIPANVTSISSGAFVNCSSLNSITIPAKVTYFGNGSVIFGGCNNLAAIVVEQGNTVYTSRDGNGNEINGIIKLADNSLIAGCQNTEIPSSVESIGNYAFAGCGNLVSIIIPENITTVGNNVFTNCSNLTEIVVKNSDLMLNKYLATNCVDILHYGADQNTVSFETNGGTQIDNQIVDFGSCVTEQVTQKNGYTFKGWYLDDEFNQLFNISTPIKYDLTLYALWEKISEDTESSVESVVDNDTQKNNHVIIAGTTAGGVAGLGALGAIIGVAVKKRKK